MTYDRTGSLAGQLTVDIVDHLKEIDDGPSILTALAAVVVVELGRFGRSIDDFAGSLVQIKTRRDAELARQKREN